MLTLQLRSPKVLDDILPVWWVLKLAQIRLQLAAENLERSTLADTVCSDQTKDLTRTRHRKSVKLERVGTIAMRHLRLQVGWQVDNRDSKYVSELTNDPCAKLPKSTHASNGHFLVQIEQPIQSVSEMNAILFSGDTSIQSLPARTTGHARLHS